MALTLSGSNGVAGVDGSAGTPALQGSDSNTGIAFGADTIIGSTGGSERFRCDSSGRLLVGATSSRNDFFNNTTTVAGGIQLELSASDNLNRFMSFTSNNSDTGGACFIFGKSRGTSANSKTIVQADDGLAQLSFHGADGSDMVEAARITAVVDGTPGANDMPGRLVFFTTADGASSPTERMRISNSGDIFINKTSTSTSTVGVAFEKAGSIYATRDGDYCGWFNRLNSDGTIILFQRSSTGVGSISVGVSSTAFNTTSDYRLKENIEPVADGITRLQQLKPSRFNFIAEPDKTVDGFLAHEVQDVVPEAIIGTKDEVDDDGNPIYQGIDQSKLVPLLTAALQEAIAKIESLETRLAALEVTP